MLNLGLGQTKGADKVARKLRRHFVLIINRAKRSLNISNYVISWILSTKIAVMSSVFTSTQQFAPIYVPVFWHGPLSSRSQLTESLQARLPHGSPQRFFVSQVMAYRVSSNWMSSKPSQHSSNCHRREEEETWCQNYRWSQNLRCSCIAVVRDRCAVLSQKGINSRIRDLDLNSTYPRLLIFH